MARELTIDATASQPIGAAGAAPARPYTGVVLIHGIGGDIKRNDTLQQVVDALSYWLNHEAGFALRSGGPGRLWLTTELTEDADPDARASRATLELAAPEPAADQLGAADDSALRLDVREVWWAESAGHPSVGTTIRWARVQWREQWAHQLLPIGRQMGPAHTAARTPARETPQALTYRPADGGRPRPQPLSRAEKGGAAARRSLGMRLRRATLRGALALYDTFQYTWKALQWMVLTPGIALLLLAMGVVQVLALVRFLEPAIVAVFTAITDRIMLHWVAEMQVYMLDYTRSAAIRQRFERELDAFLREPACTRLVVIAHSMGAAIAYEGLTTTLTQPDLSSPEKPVTLITLGPALRRVWLMADADPHRMHGVLPERVRWVNFWARYDPVAAGPLTAHSLPPLDDWHDPDRPNPHALICASLERCENVDVVNTDSTFSDHTAYWDNLEQVVGPIARELVAGHPELEQVVQAHLAGADDILQRRGQLAWRGTVAVLGGLVAGALFLFWDYFNQQPRSHLPFGFGHGLLQYGPGIVAKAIDSVGPVGTFLELLGNAWSSSPFAQGLHSVVGTFGTLPQPVVDGAASLAAAFAVTGMGMLGIGRLIAPSSPLDLTGTPKDMGTPRIIPVLAGISLLLLTLGISPVSPFGIGPGAVFRAVQALAGISVPRDAIVATFYLAAILGGVAMILGLADAARRGRWGWFLVLLLITLAFALPAAVYAGVQPNLPPIPGVSPRAGSVAANLSVDVVATAGGIGLAGVAIGTFEAVRDRRWIQSAGLLLLLIALPDFVFNAMLPTSSQYLYLYGYGIDPYVAAFLCVLIYGLWSDPAKRAQDRAARTSVTALPSTILLRLGSTAMVLGFVARYLPYYLYFTYYVFYDPFWLGVAIEAGFVVNILITGGGAILALTSLRRARRWGWFAATLVAQLALVGGLIATYPPETLLGILRLLFSFYLPAVLVSVALWVAPVGSKGGEQKTG